jgi:DNA-binding transcriptional ArsR family regulator
MQASTNRTFRALGDDTRHQLLRLLRDGSRTSGELAAHFTSSWPTISRHLAVLREAGLVIAERHGQEIRYELNTSVFQDLVDYLMAWTRPAGRKVRRKGRRLERVTRAQEA